MTMEIWRGGPEGGSGGSDWGESKSSIFWGCLRGVHVEYRMPEFPDFGPQSLAGQHSSI